MSRAIRKPDFCLGENKGTDQLRSKDDDDKTSDTQHNTISDL